MVELWVRSVVYQIILEVVIHRIELRQIPPKLRPEVSKLDRQFPLYRALFNQLRVECRHRLHYLGLHRASFFYGKLDVGYIAL